MNFEQWMASQPIAETPGATELARRAWAAGAAEARGQLGLDPHPPARVHCAACGQVLTADPVQAGALFALRAHACPWPHGVQLAPGTAFAPGGSYQVHDVAMPLLACQACGAGDLPLQLIGAGQFRCADQVACAGRAAGQEQPARD